MTDAAHDASSSLREMEERYRAIVESQAEMVCRFRPDGTILFVNGAYAKALGSTAEAMAQRNFWDFIPEQDKPAVRDMLARLTPQVPEARIENRFDTIEGARWTLWTNRALRFDDEGRLLEAQSTGIDITERRRAEEALRASEERLRASEAALREADRRKDEFLATLSHELRNPLAPLRNALNLLRLSGAAGGPLADTHEMMERQVDQLVRMVDDLLEVSRISLGTFELRKERVALDAVVRNAIETSDPLIRGAGHELVVSLPAEPVWLEGDPVRLSQILANLLNNAAKYTDPGGRIVVRAQRTGTALEIAVEDNGQGIAPEELPRVFGMFTRSAQSRRSSQGGLGIGLALALRLAQMHGGSVEAHSDGPGKGAVFTVRLALAAAPTGLPPGDQQGRARGTAPQRRVLVVDDNCDAGDSLGMILRHLGADVRVARDGDEALAAFAAYEPAVVLLDIGMPGMDGYEVARRMRALHPGRRSALVALTGWGQEEDRRRAREAGFDHHLVKPAELAALQALLASLDDDPAQARAPH